MQQRRAIFVVAWIGLLLAGLALPWLAGPATREAALTELAGRSLDELGLLAGLRDEQGNLLRTEPLAVEVVQDGGSMWITPAVVRAVDQSPWFATGNSPHLLRIEVVEDPRALALQLHLWRQGWELRSPEPLRVRTTPWVIVIAGLAGAGAAWVVRRASLGLALAGALAQFLLAVVVPPRELFTPWTTVAEWQQGPLLRRLLPAIESMTPLHLAIAVALISVCLVLVGFDHRRSKASTDELKLGSASLLAVLGALGLLGVIEAVFRSGFAASLSSGFGWLALVGLVLAWVPALARVREQWLAQRPASSPATEPSSRPPPTEDVPDARA